MQSYTAIREQIIRHNQSPKYFTKSFLETFRSAITQIRRNREQGIDDYYYDGDILTLHAYDDVRKTPFYRKNGSAYCTFLEIIRGGLD